MPSSTALTPHERCSTSIDTYARTRKHESESDVPKFA